MTTLTCGIPAHPDDCLCDVKLPDTPTPILFGSHMLWHGEAVARAVDAAVPWSGRTLADFGEALLKAHDMWASRNRRGESIDTSVLRSKVCDLLRDGTSMVDVPRLLDLDYQTVIRAMTNGAPATVWGWEENQWLTVEAAIYDDFANYGLDTLASRLGVNSDVITQLSGWYAVEVNTNGQDRYAAMRAAVKSGLHPQDAEIDLTLDGYNVTAMQLYKLRARMVKNGDVPAAMPKRRPLVW